MIWSTMMHGRSIEREKSGFGHVQFGFVVAVDQPGELVAAESCDEVAGVGRSPQRVGDMSQQRITGCVADRVVELLEVVQVQVDDADSGVSGPSQAEVKFGEEHPSIGEPREWVVVGLDFELQFDRLPFDQLGLQPRGERAELEMGDDLLGERGEEPPVGFVEPAGTPVDHAERSERVTSAVDQRGAGIEADVRIAVDVRVSSEAGILECVLDDEHVALQDRMGAERDIAR